MVRPADASEYDLVWWERGVAGGRVVQSRDTEWVVFIYPRAVLDLRSWELRYERIDCRMAMAYDVRKGEFHTGSSLTKLSPFLLVGAQDELHADDLHALLSIRRYSFNIDDTHPIGVITDSAAHPNRRVRRIAAQMLGEYWDEYEAAQATLKHLAETDPDEAVREAAKAALPRLEERRREEARWSK